VQFKLLLNQSTFTNVRRKLVCVGCGRCRFAQKVSAKLRAMNAKKKSVVSRWPFAEVIINASPSLACQAAGGLAPSGDRLRIAPKERKPRRLRT